MNRIYTKVSLYVLAALTSVSFAACSQEDLDNTSNGEVEMRTVTITASEAPVSRTSYEDKDNNLSVKWKKGDVIYVGQINDIKTLTNIDKASGFYTFKATEVNQNGMSATFVGKLPNNMNGTLLAFYGRTSNVQVTAVDKNNPVSKVRVNYVTENWNYDKVTDHNTAIQNYLSEYDFMFAKIDNYNSKTENVNFTFEHLGAVLKLNLKLDGKASFEMPTQKNVYITAPSGTKPFYQYIYVDSNGNKELSNPRIDMCFNTLNNVTTDSEGKIVLYRTLPATNGLSGNVTVKVHTAFEKTIVEGKEVYNPTETYTATITGSDMVTGKFYYTEDITLSKQ